MSYFEPYYDDVDMAEFRQWKRDYEKHQEDLRREEKERDRREYSRYHYGGFR